MTPIHLVVTGRNHAVYTRECLASLLAQDYRGMTIHWVDDCSDTNEAITIATEMLNLQQHRIVQRKSRFGGLRNVYEVMCSIGPNSIVMNIGGDDMLLRGDALSEIADLYSDSSCWFTHGYSWCSDASGSFSAPALHDNFRVHPFRWLPSSWRSELTPKVDSQDLQIGGHWFPSSGDVALYTPILEMCGLDRLRCITSAPSYLYRKHENQDGALDQRLQDFCGWAARAKPKYGRLENLGDSPVRTPHELPYGLAFVPPKAHALHVSFAINGNEVKLGPA